MLTEGMEATLLHNSGACLTTMSFCPAVRHIILRVYRNYFMKKWEILICTKQEKKNDLIFENKLNPFSVLDVSVFNSIVQFYHTSPPQNKDGSAVAAGKITMFFLYWHLSSYARRKFKNCQVESVGLCTCVSIYL